MTTAIANKTTFLMSHPGDQMLLAEYRTRQAIQAIQAPSLSALP